MVVDFLKIGNAEVLGLSLSDCHPGTLMGLTGS